MTRQARKALLIDEHVCPWWLAYTFDNPLRRLIHNPQKILGEFISPGDTVMDVGCGMGYFSLAMAKLVGKKGRVISVDLQTEMLDRVRYRAEQQGLLSRVQLHQCESDKIGVGEPVDFALAFWMVHEVPCQAAFFKDIASLLKPKAHFLMVEPKIHVKKVDFRQSVELAGMCGLKLVAEPSVNMSRAALFKLR